MTDARTYQLSQLGTLEAEAIFIFREVVAEFERPVLLFSGGKDSIVMLRLAEKAFYPARIPFPVMHVDTGHNFDEVLRFRDSRVEQLGIQLVVASVQEAIDNGSVSEPPDGTRNRIQTPVLLDALEKHRFTAIFGGARRDEEKARAKERVFSFRDEFGQWDPKNQRPELWNIYNARVHRGESIRVFPLSNWTELDVWHYVAAERALRSRPSISRTTGARSSPATVMLLRRARGVPYVTRGDDEETRRPRRVRYRTIGDAMSCTGAVLSEASTFADRSSTRSLSTRITERGATRGGRQARARPPWKTARSEGLFLTVDMLRFATAGSVDDGKSTLIGRLLIRHQAACSTTSSTRSSGPASAARGDELHRPRAFHRRPARRAGAGHHDRRGVPIFCYTAAQIHHRRHSWAHPVHAQHGHRGLDGRPGAHPDRRAQRASSSRAVGTPSSRRCCEVPHVVLCVNKMDLVDYDRRRSSTGSVAEFGRCLRDQAAWCPT